MHPGFQRICSVLYTGPYSVTKRIVIYFLIPTAILVLAIGPIYPGTTRGGGNDLVEGILMLIPVAYVFFLCVAVLIDSMIIWIGRIFSYFLKTKSDGHRPPLQLK